MADVQMTKYTPLMFAGGTMIGGMAPEHIEGFEKHLRTLRKKLRPSRRMKTSSKKAMMRMRNPLSS